MTEHQFQTKFLRELRQYGWFYKASDRYRAGIPDIIGCVKGAFVALELKVEPNRTTKLQDYEIERIEKEMGYVAVVSYNNKTKMYKTHNTEHKTLGDLTKCIIKLSLSSIKRTVSKL